MRAQTYRNIEHIIVDDGSTDFDRVQPLLDAYINEVSFSVKVFHKENGGKHTASNMAWDHATGEFLIKLDADDELTPNCISFLVKTWFEIPEDVRGQYWCVHGRCIDQVERYLIGKPYPDGINQLSIRDAVKTMLDTPGEKTGLMLRRVIDQFRYPEPKGVKFVTEAVVWCQLRYKWRIWFTNEIVRIYYINEGYSLAHQKRSKQSFANNAFNKKWFILHRKEFPIGGKKTTIKYILKYAVSYMCAAKEYKKHNPYFLENEFLINVMLVGIAIPAFLGKIFCQLKYKLQ